MAAPRRRRWPWLVAAAVLFALAAWLMAGADTEPVEAADKVVLPRHMTPSEQARADQRRSMPEVVPPVGQPPTKPQPRDPMLAAMPAEVKHAAMVIEANAIRHSDLGNLMVDCLFTGEGDFLASLADAGFDPLKKLDRVAVVDNSIMMTGDFHAADIPALIHGERRGQFGANSELFAHDFVDGGSESFGLWKGEVLVYGETPDEVKTVLDRLDGKGDPNAGHVLSEGDSYGEMYGVVKAGPLADELSENNPEVARLLTEAASSIKLHADVTHDVGLVADIEGTDSTKTQDLRKALGTALTLAKLQAEANGKKNAAEVLGFARVAPPEGSSANFRLEAGLPYEFLERNLKKCVEEKKRRLAEAAAAPPVDAGAE